MQVYVDCDSVTTDRLAALAALPSDALVTYVFSGAWAAGTWKRVRDCYSVGHDPDGACEKLRHAGFAVWPPRADPGPAWEKITERVTCEEPVFVTKDVLGMTCFCMHNPHFVKAHVTDGSGNYTPIERSLVGTDVHAMIVLLILSGKSPALPGIATEAELSSTDVDLARVYDRDEASLDAKVLVALLDAVIAQRPVENQWDKQRALFGDADIALACTRAYYECFERLLHFHVNAFARGSDDTFVFPYDRAPLLHDLRIVAQQPSDAWPHVHSPEERVVVRDWDDTCQDIATMAPELLRARYPHLALEIDRDPLMPDACASYVPPRMPSVVRLRKMCCNSIIR